MLKNVAEVAVYYICHFIVDFISAIFVLGVLPGNCISSTQFFWCVILYNFFAFAFQPLIGIVLDKYKTYKYISIIGISLIGICYLINIHPILLASIVGIGNALFHLEGGVNIFNLCDNKSFLNGLFIAPGAFGIFLGTYFSKILSQSYMPYIMILLAIFLLFFVQKNKNDNKLVEENFKYDLRKNIRIILLIGFSIVVRSIGSSAIIYEWKSKDALILGIFYTLCIILGKTFGGLIGDKFGLKKVSTISLCLAGISLVLGFKFPLFGFCGIFLFNIPTAITLFLLASTMKKNIACAIGMNTLFLFIGYIVCLIPFTINNILLIIVTCVLAALSISYVCDIKQKL